MGLIMDNCPHCKKPLFEDSHPEKLQCPKCRKTNMVLRKEGEKVKGWFCDNCNAGPYLICLSGLVPKN